MSSTRMTITRRPLALVLAAGFARRFGADKRVATLPDGNTVLDRVIQRIGAAGLEVIPVLRVSDEELYARYPAAFVIADDIATKGMGSTLAAAIAQLPTDRDCMICLGDMPFVQTSTYAALATLAHPARIICTFHTGRRGNPVLFGANFLPDLQLLSGDIGAKMLLQKYADAVIEMPVTDAGIHLDIDSRDDLESIQNF